MFPLLGITGEQVQRVIAQPVPISLLGKAIVSVCLGLRWSELAGLQWEDIDWLGGELVRLLDVLKAHKQ